MFLNLTLQLFISRDNLGICIITHLTHSCVQQIMLEQSPARSSFKRWGRVLYLLSGFIRETADWWEWNRSALWLLFVAFFYLFVRLGFFKPQSETHRIR